MELVKAHYERLNADISGTFIDTAREKALMIEDVEIIRESARASRVDEWDCKSEPLAAAAITLLGSVRDVLADALAVELFESDTPMDDLRKYIAEKDALEAFRMRVLGSVKSCGALGARDFPDDERLILLVQALMP